MPTRFSKALVFSPADRMSSHVHALGTTISSAPFSRSSLAASGNSLSAQIMAPTLTSPSSPATLQTSNDSPALQFTSQPMSSTLGFGFKTSSLPKSQMNTLE